MHVRVNGKSIACRVDAGARASIRELKAAVTARVSAPEGQEVTLVHAQRFLTDDDAPLAAYDVKEGSVLEVNFTPAKREYSSYVDDDAQARAYYHIVSASLSVVWGVTWMVFSCSLSACMRGEHVPRPLSI